MCGIVGLFLKNPALQPELGRHLETMLIGMTERGPDSAGIAVYHSAVPEGQCKITLFNADMHYHWRGLAGALAEALDVETDIEQKGNHARLVAHCPEDKVLPWIDPGASSGRAHHGLWPAHGSLQGHGFAGRRFRRATASPRWKAAMRSAIPAWRPRVR